LPLDGRRGVVEGLLMKLLDKRKAKSIVFCPKCRSQTFTKILYGEIEIHCKSCGCDFEVVIRAHKEETA